MRPRVLIGRIGSGSNAPMAEMDSSAAAAAPAGTAAALAPATRNRAALAPITVIPEVLRSELLRCVQGHNSSHAGPMHCDSRYQSQWHLRLVSFLPLFGGQQNKRWHKYISPCTSIVYGSGFAWCNLMYQITHSSDHHQHTYLHDWNYRRHAHVDKLFYTCTSPLCQQ